MADFLVHRRAAIHMVCLALPVAWAGLAGLVAVRSFARSPALFPVGVHDSRSASGVMVLQVARPEHPVPPPLAVPLVASPC